MKDLLTGKNYLERGIGVLEILISLMVITSAVTAVLLVVPFGVNKVQYRSFGSEEVHLDNELSNDALYRAIEMLEKAEALSEQDFNSIVSSSSLDDNYFHKELTVSDISPCRKDVTSSISWSYDSSRPQNITLTSILGSTEELLALGGDCDLTGSTVTEWWHPNTFVSVDFGSLGGDNNGTSATSIDIINDSGEKYAVLSSTHGTSSVYDVWVVNITDMTDGASPYTAFLESALNTSDGLNDIDVVGDYSFAANNEDSRQLHVVNLTDLTAPDGIASVSLPGVSSGGSYPEGRRVYYYNDRIYVGINETSGAEFHIFDVSMPSTPTHLGKLELFHNIHDIIVRGDYAYLATSANSGELMVINISDPGVLDDVLYPLNPHHPDNSGMKFDAPGDHDATSLHLLGNKLYLGRKGGYNNPSVHNFFILDIENPASIISLGSKYITRNPNVSLGITAIVVSDKYAFLGTDDSNAEFQVFRIESPANIQNCSEPGYPGGFSGCGKYNFPAKITDLEYEENFIFASVESNDAFRVIFDDVSQY